MSVIYYIIIILLVALMSISGDDNLNATSGALPETTTNSDGGSDGNTYCSLNQQKATAITNAFLINSTLFYCIADVCYRSIISDNDMTELPGKQKSNIFLEIDSKEFHTINSSFMIDDGSKPAVVLLFGQRGGQGKRFSYIFYQMGADMYAPVGENYTEMPWGLDKNGIVNGSIFLKYTNTEEWIYGGLAHNLVHQRLIISADITSKNMPKVYERKTDINHINEDYVDVDAIRLYVALIYHKGWTYGMDADKKWYKLTHDGGAEMKEVEEYSLHKFFNCDNTSPLITPMKSSSTETAINKTTDSTGSGDQSSTTPNSKKTSDKSWLWILLIIILLILIILAIICLILCCCCQSKPSKEKPIPLQSPPAAVTTDPKAADTEPTDIPAIRSDVDTTRSEADLK